MYALLRFSGAREHDPAIPEWFETEEPRLAALARHWFSRLRACGTDVRELVHDGCPVACVGDAPFGYVNVFTAHAAVGFFHGASLPDPTKLLEGTGRYMRHVKLRADGRVEAPALEALIRAAYDDIRERLAHAERQR
jgi:hypothetical protein